MSTTKIRAWWPVLIAALALPLLAQDETGRSTPPTDEPRQGIPTPEEVKERLERESKARLAQERLAHFRLCDENRNGWISFREAEYALLMDRKEYALYDTNGDGRISRDEFDKRYAKILDQVGGYPALRSELQDEIPGVTAPTFTPIEPELPTSRLTTPSELLLTYDNDQDAALDRTELATMFRALAIDLPPNGALAMLDENHTAVLEMTELVGLAEEIAARLAPDEGPMGITDADIFRRLYSDTRPRLLPDGATPRPPLIPGPVSHFRRLDLDQNGFIDEEDLRTLLTPARVGVRPGTVLSALDTDGDGRLDRSEFLRSVGGKPAAR